ncbi:MAG: two-component system response regulator [Phycisphaerae bacterium]
MDDKQVMIVDDDPGILFTVEAVLQDAGYQVTACQGGQECLLRLQEGFRGLILMDIMMPRMDGWDTIRCIKEEGLLEGNLVCMLTAVAAPGPKMEGLQECVMDYVTKPFDAQTLVAAVEDCLSFAV